MMKKEDDVAVDYENENLCVTRLNDSDTVYWEIVPQNSVFIAIHLSDRKNVGVGEDSYGQHDTWIGLNWVHTSQLILHVIQQVLQWKQIFVQISCD